MDGNCLSIWKELKDRFYDGDIQNSGYSRRDCTLKQCHCFISSYYTKLMLLWQELDNFRLIPACDCDNSCLPIDKIHSYKDSYQVFIFLKGLNDQYSAVRSQIVLMDPLSNISNVYSLLVQQERQIVSPIDESKLLGFSIGQF